MPSSSVSFRISRHTEDLAETLHALSQRLVALEQRLGSLEEQLQELRRQPQADPAELEGIAQVEVNIERLLLDCRQLLGEHDPGRQRPPEIAHGDGGDAVTDLQPLAGPRGGSEPQLDDGPAVEAA